MSDQSKFWIQTLLIPIVLASVGYFINGTLQKQQRAFDKIKLADQIINEAFDSNNPDKALALTSIIHTLLDDRPFSDSLSKLINRYYLRRAEVALKQGDEKQYNQIANAAETFQGKNVTILDSLAVNPTAQKAEQAKDFEQKGLLHLRQGNLDSAYTNFSKADKVYPGFHSAYEIADTIRVKSKEVRDGSLNPDLAKEQVLKTIRSNYSWKLNPQELKKD